MSVRKGGRGGDDDFLSPCSSDGESSSSTGEDRKSTDGVVDHVDAGTNHGTHRAFASFVASSRKRSFSEVVQPERRKKVISSSPSVASSQHVGKNHDYSCSANESSSDSTQKMPPSNGKGTVPSNARALQNRWDNMLDRLLAFKAKHGHCLVPNRYNEDRSLGAWVSTQRRHYKAKESENPNHDSNPMTEERMSKLREIGFVWATSDPRHTPWNVRFDELREYRERFGK